MKRSTRPAPSLVLALCLLAAASAHAQPRNELADVFPYEADVRVTGPGPARARLPARVLEQTRALGDLRVFDADGLSIPARIDSAARRPHGEPAIRLPAVPREAARREVARPDLSPLFVEELVLDAPPAPAHGEAWELGFDTDGRAFVRAVEIVVTDAAGVPVTTTRRASIYRFASPRRERLRVTLPSTGAGDLVRVRLEGEGGYLEPAAWLEATPTPPAPARFELPLVELSRRVEDRRTTVVLARPRRVVPDRLALSTATASFDRTIRVRDEGDGATGGWLVTSEVYRDAELGHVQALEVPLERAGGDRLVVVLDGEGAPLEGLGFTAVVTDAAIAFESDGRDATLRWGGGRARDLPGVGDFGASIEPRRATVSAPRDNLLHSPRPAFELAAAGGAAVDVRRFSHRQEITVGETDEGLSRLRLDLATRAAARADLADVRVVDGDGWQWPYLVERGPDRERVELTVRDPARGDDGRSRHLLSLPVARATVDRLSVATEATFVDRAFEVRAILDDGAEVGIAAGRLERRPGADQEPMTVTLTPTRATALVLVIDDGDDRPLDLTAAWAESDSVDLYVAAPPGRYALLAGDPDAEAPRYELARARDLALEVHAGAAVAGALGPNPDHVPPSRYRSALLEDVALWAVLALAILVLAFLTLRAARDDDEGDEGDEPMPGEDGGAPPNPPGSPSAAPSPPA